VTVRIPGRPVDADTLGVVNRHGNYCGAQVSGSFPVDPARQWLTVSEVLPGPNQTFTSRGGKRRLRRYLKVSSRVCLRGKGP